MTTPTPGGPVDVGNDRELWAVLVALEPLDSRKWDYLDLQRRTFDAEQMLQEPWSSGERALIEVAQSLWNDGRVDLGYVACALGPRHLQAVLDATAIRAGQPLASDTRSAIGRVSAAALRRGDRTRSQQPALRGPEVTFDRPAPDRSRER